MSAAQASQTTEQKRWGPGNKLLALAMAAMVSLATATTALSVTCEHDTSFTLNLYVPNCGNYFDYRLTYGIECTASGDEACQYCYYYTIYWWDPNIPGWNNGSSTASHSLSVSCGATSSGTTLWSRYNSPVGGTYKVVVTMNKGPCPSQGGVYNVTNSGNSFTLVPCNDPPGG